MHSPLLLVGPVLLLTHQEVLLRYYFGWADDTAFGSPTHLHNTANRTKLKTPGGGHIRTNPPKKAREQTAGRARLLGRPQRRPAHQPMPIPGLPHVRQPESRLMHISVAPSTYITFSLTARDKETTRPSEYVRVEPLQSSTHQSAARQGEPPLWLCAADTTRQKARLIAPVYRLPLQVNYNQTPTTDPTFDKRPATNT